MGMQTAEPCEQCGYDLRGSDDATPCPECGTSRGDLAERRRLLRRDWPWCGCVLLGLILVAIGSFAAIDVVGLGNFGSTFYGWRGRYTGFSTAVGVPGPRPFALSMLQRSIGDAPGPLGMRGIIATTLTIAGLLLVTAKPIGEQGGVFRKLVRWVSVVLIGIAFGHFASANGISYYGSDGRLGRLVPVLLGGLDFPLAVLFWLYLIRVAGRLVDEPLRVATTRTAWLTIVAMAGVVGLNVVLPAAVDWQFQRDTQLNSGAGMSAAGVAVVAAVAGIVGWVVVGGLVLRLIVVLRLPRLVGAWITRWPIGVSVATRRRLGGVLLVLAVVPAFDTVFRTDFREGLWTNLPLINFPGPKLWAGPLLGGWAYDHWSGSSLPSRTLPLLLSVVGAWLLTEPSDTDERHSLRRLAARWWAVAGFGVAFVLRNSPPLLDSTDPRSAITLQNVIAYELPATVLLFVWLGRAERGWNVLAAIVGVLIVLPQAAFALSGRMWGRWDDPAAVVSACLYGAVATVIAAVVGQRLMRSGPRVSPRAAGQTLTH
ncbi:MAG: hypothetical protein AAGD32_09440 [Planctomycetota bacterium]